jgi:alkanesulfonate monooxygenase SsuD/methylene tetrahydromethanopterin reductase-like flavin-dependent oxidoreductase (luciferase family)
MKFGFIPIEGGHYYDEFLEEVELGESLGFDSVWLEEHHSVRDHYWPSPLIGLAGAASRTERLLLGTDVLVMPFYHPVRVAEDCALLHIMSRGRFILGAAIGYKPDEFGLYEVALSNRGARFEEAIRLIRQLWAQETVDFEGRYYHVHGLKIEPRPADGKGPPIWLGGWGDLSLTRAAILGDAWLPGPTANLAKLLEAQSYYHRKLREIEMAPASTPTPLTREVVIAASEDEARRVAEEHLLISYREEYGTAGWSHPLIGGEDETPTDRFEALCRDRFLVGSPDSIIEQLTRLRTSFGVDHLICRLYFPGLAHQFILKELRLLADEVMPAFAKEAHAHQHSD